MAVRPRRKVASPARDRIATRRCTRAEPPRRVMRVSSPSARSRKSLWPRAGQRASRVRSRRHREFSARPLGSIGLCSGDSTSVVDVRSFGGLGERYSIARPAAPRSPLPETIPRPSPPSSPLMEARPAATVALRRGPVRPSRPRAARPSSVAAHSRRSVRRLWQLYARPPLLPPRARVALRVGH